MPEPWENAIKDLSNRIASMTTELEGLKSSGATGASVAEMKKELDGLKGELTALKTPRPAPAPAPAPKAKGFFATVLGLDE